MVKLAALRLAIAKNVPKIARQDAALRLSLPVFLAVPSIFRSLPPGRPRWILNSAYDILKIAVHTQIFFEGIGAGHDAQTHIST